MKYRADIDGLRAIAVLLVVFNHVGWSLFSGGYIGVDVFFVISGYLITSLLVKDISEKKFSIAQFYKKRVLRLAPAYFTVLIVVSIFAWQLMLPDEIIKYVSSVIYATFLMANIYMYDEVGDYFSQTVDSIPLLHLWSLGVEEQFYIFWPIFLLIIFNTKIKKYIILIIVILIYFSLYYTYYKININSDKAYYMMPIRACELLIGAIIVFLPKISISQKISNLMVFGGFLTLFLVAIFF